MRVNAVSTIGSVILALLFSVLANAAQGSHVGTSTGNVKHGKELYQRYCIFCHGPHGDGTGESAPYLNPKPRDFTLGTFKCRSTPTGSLPLDSDLYETISRGIYASAMPSWNALTRQQRVDLIAYIKSFAPRFGEEQPAPTLPNPTQPSDSADGVKRGADLFRTKCQSCHGKEGRGNGPVASTLADSKGYPITPFDFTSGKQFKCGESDRDLYRDVLTGLDGTPMPSFADSLDPDQIWDLVHYVRTLRAPGRKDASLGQAGPVNK